LLRALSRYPGLSLLIGLALVVFPFSLPVAAGQLTAVAAALSIVDPRLYSSAAALPNLPELMGELQVWRWFTPILLHFSVLHLAFNCVVVIELGRRVESASGTRGFCVLVLAIGGLSNLGQYAFGGGPLFGGLSGVGYGLLGYLMVRHRLAPQVAAFQLPAGLSLGLLIFLVIFSTGITEPFGLNVANAAHWGGLLVGTLAALVAGRGKWGA
jgi:GlpG protein